MKNEINDTPLYVRLNEERAQGIWQQRGNGTFGVMCTKTDDGHFSEYSVLAVNTSFRMKETIKANFEYTALAVNNLHKLAEALQTQIDEWHSEDSNFNQEEPASLKLARTALKAIS